MPDSEQTLPPCIHCGETRGHTYGCEHPYPSSRQQIPQENVPFAIRDIAANEPAQTRDEGDVQSFMADAIERGDHAK